MKKIIIFLVVITGLTLHAQKVEKLPKAVVNPKDIDSIIKYEKVFSANYEANAPVDKKWFESKIGSKKVLIIAAHATAQMRDGKIKLCDGGTGSLLIELNKLLDVSIIYTTYLSPSDPNYYDDNEFKDYLSKLVEDIKPIIVIDLHGSHPYRPYDVDFGTMNGKSYLTRQDLFELLKNSLKMGGLINQSQDYFSAEKNQTITKYIFNKGIPCIQLEINSNYLSPDLGNIYGQKSAQLLQSLINFINAIPQ